MSIYKEFREYFLRADATPGGDTPDNPLDITTGTTVVVNGKVKSNRFVKNGYPTFAIFQKLFESITFKYNTDDKATTTEQGLVTVATDTQAFAKEDSSTTTRVLLPHQLPDFKGAVVTYYDITNDTEYGTIGEIPAGHTFRALISITAGTVDPVQLADAINVALATALLDYYTKTEVDNLLADKADAATTYTETEVDNLLSAKANAADVYTKLETDAAYEPILSDSGWTALSSSGLGDIAEYDLDYRKIRNEVTLRGLVAFTPGGAGEYLIATLPVGHRPLDVIYIPLFSVYIGGPSPVFTITPVVIDTSGTITIYTQAGYGTLDRVYFSEHVDFYTN